MSWKHGLAHLLRAVGLGTCLLPSAVEAAMLKSVQSGTVTMDEATETLTLPTPVNSTRAFLVCSSQTNSSAPNNRVTCEMTDTTVVITSGTANDNLVVQWSVAEFDAGVDVQRGTASFATNETQPGGTTVPINWAYLPRSFALISTRTTSSVTQTRRDEQWTVRARLPPDPCCAPPDEWAQTLELSRLETGIALTVAWQVVRFSHWGPAAGPWNDAGVGISVQHGLTTLPTNASTASAALPTAVDVNTSLLIMTGRAGTATAGIESRYQVMGEIDGTGTTLNFTRVSTGIGSNTQVEIAWQVVTLTDGGEARKGLVGQSTAFGSNTSSLTGTLSSSVDPTRTIPFFSLLGGSGTRNRHLDDTSWTAVVDGSHLTFSRGVSTTVATQISYFAVQFFRCTGETVSSPLCHLGSSASSAQGTVNWSSGNAVIILRKDTTVGGGSCDQSAATCFLAGDNPVNGTSYNVGDTVGSATVVYNGTAATETSFSQTGLTDDTTYFYKVYPKTAATTYGAGTEVKATPRAGNTLWSYMQAGGSTLSPPIPGGGRVYASSNGSKIFSINSSDGSQTATPMKTYNAVQGWVTWFPKASSVEVVIGGDQGGYLYSMNPATGLTNWAWKSGYSTAWSAENFQAAISVQLRQFANQAFRDNYDTNYSYGGDVLFASTRQTSDTANKLFAIKETDGDGLWNFDPVNLTPSRPMDIVIGQPYVDYGRNRLYVTSRAGAAGTQSSLWIIDSLNGGLLADFALGHIDASPTLSSDASTLYVGNNSGTLYAINAGALTQKWSSSVVSPASAVKGFIWEDYLIAGRLYFVTADGNVYCVQDTGTSGVKCTDWTVNPRKPVATGTVSQSLLTESALYVGGSDGNLYQINPATGAIVTQFQVGDGTKTLGDVSSQDGTTHVYLGTSEGRIYKIALPLP